MSNIFDMFVGLADSSLCNMNGMFSSWLFEQAGTGGSVGRLAELCYSDVNAGCAIAYGDAVGWKKHFERYHAGSFDVLLELLGDAFVEYSQLPE